MVEKTRTRAVQRPNGESDKRVRAREIGLHFGILSPGPLNAITDVAGVRVGHCTIIEGDSVRTGVTAVLPHGGNLFQEKVPAAVVVGNGFGKLVGSTQVAELGTIETPILLTNTLSVFSVADALAAYVLEQPGNEEVRSINPLVAETNDGYLNDIRRHRVGRAHVLAAIESARSGPVEEGSVGAGTGTCALGFKGGIGTASRRLPDPLGRHTIGVLVQSNFGGSLTLGGAPVGRKLQPNDFRASVDDRPQDGGSCIIVAATDAPLDARQLQRLASRALLGLGAVGSPMSHGSGDYVIAFTSARESRVPHESPGVTRSITSLRDEHLSPLFQAVREATEEAIINSLLTATTVTGVDDHTCKALPVDRVVEICKQYGVIQPTEANTNNPGSD